MKSKQIYAASNDKKILEQNLRCVSNMKYELNKAVIGWNDAKADKEAIQGML